MTKKTIHKLASLFLPRLVEKQATGKARFFRLFSMLMETFGKFFKSLSNEDFYLLYAYCHTMWYFNRVLSIEQIDNLIKDFKLIAYFKTDFEHPTSTCSDCKGEGTYECENCEGRGELTCPECDGEGAPCKCQTGEIECSLCDGTGIFYCDNCNGGEIEDEDDIVIQGFGVFTKTESDLEKIEYFYNNKKPVEQDYVMLEDGIWFYEFQISEYENSDLLNTIKKNEFYVNKIISKPDEIGKYLKDVIFTRLNLMFDVYENLSPKF